MSICAGWRRHWSMWSMCSRIVHLAETPVLTIYNMLLDLLRSSSFVASWHRATQLSCSPAQTGGHKIMDDNDISIYMPEELERLESLRVRVCAHSCLWCEPTQERGDGRRPPHSLPRHWLEFCDEISRRSTTGGGDLTDWAHDEGIGMRTGDVVFLHRLTDRHHQKPLQSPWPWTWCLNLAKI
jgi:hypothetical protein